MQFKNKAHRTIFAIKTGVSAAGVGGLVELINSGRIDMASSLEFGGALTVVTIAQQIKDNMYYRRDPEARLDEAEEGRKKLLSKPGKSLISQVVLLYRGTDNKARREAAEAELQRDRVTAAEDSSKFIQKLEVAIGIGDVKEAGRLLDLLAVDTEFSARMQIILNEGLLKASVNGYNQLLTLFLERGAQVNTQDSRTGNTALHNCSARGNLGGVIILNDAKADANITNIKGRTPLHSGAENDNSFVNGEIAKMLIVEFKCNPYTRDLVGLHLAEELAYLNGNYYIAEVIQKNSPRRIREVGRSMVIHLAKRIGLLEEYG
jgi:hypothetical protein